MFSNSVLTTALLLLGVVKASTTTSEEEVQCPPAGGSSTTITVSGQSDSIYATKAWKDVFEQKCPGFTVVAKTEAEHELSLRQVCNQNLSSDQTEAEIAGMSQEFDDEFPQVKVVGNDNEYTYKCTDSDREMIQVLVAHDALTFVVKRNTFAERCLESLPGKGLTLDQLRWIYSSYTEDELKATGWDPNSVPNSNHDNQRTWEELGGTRCFNGVIDVGGIQDITQHFLKNAILSDWRNGEVFRSTYMHSIVSEDIRTYMDENPNTLGIFWYGSVANRPREFVAAAIQNPQTREYVMPSPNGIATEAYPVSRQIYLNVRKDQEILDKVRPFFEVGFTPEGDKAMETWQFVPITPIEKAVMRARLGTQFAPKPEETNCGAANGQLTMAGSSALYPVAKIWAGVYHVLCQESIEVILDGGVSDEGARRVCDQNLLDGEGPVDIGEMDRKWHGSEATTSDGWTYNCKLSDRKVVQIEAAVESLTVVTARGGPAHRCINQLKGLSIPQLRWIYSSFTEEQLLAEPNGFMPSNSDGNEKTHRWSELLDHEECQAMEILLAGPDDRDAGYQFMAERIFNREKGETFDPNRDITTVTSTGYSYYPANSPADLVKYVTTNGDAIGFMTSNAAIQYRDELLSVPIMSSSNHMIAPDPLNIADGRYPLMKPVYMNLNNEADSLQYTEPFIEFGLSPAGQHLATLAGYTVLSEARQTIMHTRAQSAMGISSTAVQQSQSLGCATKNIKASGASPAVRAVDLWGGIYQVGCGVRVQSSTVGSTYSAARVCAQDGAGSVVDVALMSRPFTKEEAVLRDNADGVVFDCIKGDQSRSVVQAHIASDGMAFGVKKWGAASDCINKLGGLTLDQVRWIYSSLSENELAAEGEWDRNSIPNSDNDPNTHKWSELNAECEEREIRIAGANTGSSAYTFFGDIVFKSHGERAANSREYPYFGDKEDHEVAWFLEENPEAIGFFSSYIYTEGALSEGIFEVVSIRNNAGVFVGPTSRTVNDGTYDHFARPLYMNILNEPTVLENAIPFLEFAFSEEGTAFIEISGYGPVPAAEMKATMEKLRKAADGGYIVGSDADQPTRSSPSSSSESEGGGGLGGGAVFGIALATLVVALAAGYVLMKKSRSWAARKEAIDTNLFSDFNASPAYSDSPNDTTPEIRPYSDDPDDAPGGIPDATMA